VEWLASTNPNQALGEEQPQTAADAAAPIDIPVSGPQYQSYYIAVFNGHLTEFDGNYREAISAINEFTETLRRQDAVYDLSILKLPIDFSSAVNLQGNTQSAAADASFSIRLVMGAGNAI
jgi:hypothetical protein